jgi:hypothetical protein
MMDKSLLYLYDNLKQTSFLHNFLPIEATIKS